MMHITWEYAALYYLNWWQRYDEPYRLALESNDPERQRLALCRAAVRYGVARNLPLASDVHLDFNRLEPATEALMSVSKIDIEGERMVQTIYRLRDVISEIYGAKDLLSLTTKFLWLRFRGTVRIYDRNVCSSLGHTDRDLEAYYQVWNQQYNDCSFLIADACSLLPNIVAFSVDSSATKESVEAIANKSWFHERVFDIYHWHTGA
jgi:hypothetical protein